MKRRNNKCLNVRCNSGKILVYICSRAANTGYLADIIARKLQGNKYGSMTCLAGVGAGISGFIESAKGFEKNIILDGCPVSCGKKYLINLIFPINNY